MRKNVIILTFAALLIFIPTNVNAITLKEYENKVIKYQNELNSKKNAINKTESSIKAAKKEIEEIKSTIKKLAKEVETLTEEIKVGEKEIKEKSQQTKELFEYLQYSSGENVYLEYAFGAETITDLIYRMSIVEQLTEYNDQMIDDIEKMIKQNEKRQDDIAKKNKEMESEQKKLEKKVVDLGEEKETLEDGAVSSAQQLKIYKEIVASYKKQGCKSSDVIGVDCAVSASAGAFRRPIIKGYITSNFGPRWGTFHRGMDLSTSNPYSAKIYPVANGTITAKYLDSYGALVIIIEHYDVVKGKWYTSLYCHMSKFAPNLYVGKKVTSDDYIGYMGSTGYSTGPHLHLEVAPCRLYKDNNCGTWKKYSNYVKNLYYNSNYKGPKTYISFPSSWSTR